MSRAREITALCCLALLVALLAPRPALAVKDSPVYTLDSLVYKSEAIVLGEVWDIRTVAKPARPLVIHRIRVLKTFFGQSLNQETIDIAELDGYHLAPGMTGIADSTRSFQTGDQLYLFLVSRNGGAGVGWVAISGGVRLLANDRVYAFRQYLGLWDGAGRLQVPMGDFAAVTPLSFPKAPEPLPQDVFEKKLESSR